MSIDYFEFFREDIWPGEWSSNEDDAGNNDRVYCRPISRHRQSHTNRQYRFSTDQETFPRRFEVSLRDWFSSRVNNSRWSFFQLSILQGGIGKRRNASFISKPIFRWTTSVFAV